MTSVSEQLLLVGSIPLDTPQDVFETFGAPLGRFLSAVPDGEVGPRSHWISRIHYQVFAGHPEFDILAHPRPDNGVERLNPHDNPTGGSSRFATGSSACASAIRVGASASPATPSIPTSCSGR